MEDFDQLTTQAIMIAESRKTAGPGKYYPTAYENLDQLKEILAEDIPTSHLQIDFEEEIIRYDGRPLSDLLLDLDHQIAMESSGHSRKAKATVLALTALIVEAEA